MDTPNSTLSSIPPRLESGAQPRTPSRSPARQRILDDILADLSPSTTLEAFTSPSGKLRASVEAATASERAFGIRATLACKNIEEWVTELADWPWPASGGFEPPAAKRRKLSVTNDDERRQWSGYQAGSKEETLEMAYMGSLPVQDVLAYEKRVEEIQEDMEELDVEEIKRTVLSNFSAKSRPSSSASNAAPLPTLLSNYTKMDDLTAIVTATVLKALPNLMSLMRLMDVWSIRLGLLRKIPSLLELLDDAEVALKSGWQAILVPGLSGRTAEREQYLERNAFEIMRDVLQEKVTTLGQKLDYMLDTLEGRDDVLPEHWLDRMEAIETDYGDWMVSGDRNVREGEWAKMAKRRKEEAERLRAEEDAREAARLEEEALRKAQVDRLKTEETAREAARLEAETLRKAEKDRLRAERVAREAVCLEVECLRKAEEARMKATKKAREAERLETERLRAVENDRLRREAETTRKSTDKIKADKEASLKLQLEMEAEEAQLEEEKAREIVEAELRSKEEEARFEEAARQHALRDADEIKAQEIPRPTNNFLTSHGEAEGNSHTSGVASAAVVDAASEPSTSTAESSMIEDVPGAESDQHTSSSVISSLDGHMSEASEDSPQDGESLDSKTVPDSSESFEQALDAPKRKESIPPATRPSEKQLTVQSSSPQNEVDRPTSKGSPQSPSKCTKFGHPIANMLRRTPTDLTKKSPTIPSTSRDRPSSPNADIEQLLKIHVQSLRALEATSNDPSQQDEEWTVVDLPVEKSLTSSQIEGQAEDFNQLLLDGALMLDGAEASKPHTRRASHDCSYSVLNPTPGIYQAEPTEYFVMPTQSVRCPDSTALLTLHNANFVIFDDSKPMWKGEMMRSKPTANYLIRIEPKPPSYPKWWVKRKFADFETLHENLERVAEDAGVAAFAGQYQDFTKEHKDLPSWKEYPKGVLNLMLARYLFDACSYPLLAECYTMKQFLEKNQESQDLSSSPTSSKPSLSLSGPMIVEEVSPTMDSSPVASSHSYTEPAQPLVNFSFGDGTNESKMSEVHELQGCCNSFTPTNTRSIPLSSMEIEESISRRGSLSSNSPVIITHNGNTHRDDTPSSLPAYSSRNLTSDTTNRLPELEEQSLSARRRKLSSFAYLVAETSPEPVPPVSDTNEADSSGSTTQSDLPASSPNAVSIPQMSDSHVSSHLPLENNEKLGDQPSPPRRPTLSEALTDNPWKEDGNLVPPVDIPYLPDLLPSSSVKASTSPATLSPQGTPPTPTTDIPDFSSLTPDSPFDRPSTPSMGAPLLPNLEVSPNLPSPSRKANAADNPMQSQISSLLASLPARIRLESEPGLDTATKSPFLSSQSTTYRPANMRRSLTPTPRSYSSLSLRAPTPNFTLTPAYGRYTNRARHTAHPEINIYHLSHHGEAPIKLFIRRVGEHGERLMVRVGGGWSDLGAYLTEYAAHHGHRVANISSPVEVQNFSNGAGNRSVSGSSLGTATQRGTGNGRKSPVPRSSSVMERERPLSSLYVRKTRRSIGETESHTAKINLKSPSTPLPPTKQGLPSVQQSPSHGTPPSRNVSRLSWTEEEAGLGLAGPTVRPKMISAESKEWVQSMTEKVKQASAEKEEKSRRISLGEGDKSTKKLFRKGDAKFGV